MKLLELELSGFKSFARKTAFRFDTGITAVIGPNGSGKSNLAESIRWVLGEQSLKQLRGHKSEDVIFSGSAGHNRCNEARVSLTLSNESGRLATEAPEVTITRLLNRAGEGEYLLNGDPVRLFDIQHLLAEAGLGAKSYAVVSQGMVDQYLIASPAQRRELFDEATGIKALQLQLKRAERQLEQAAQRLHELQSVIQELEPRLRVLKRQARRFEERSTVEEQFKTTQALWYRTEWHNRCADIEQAQAASITMSERIAAARQARERAESQLIAALSDHSNDKNRGVSPLEQELRFAEQEYERAQQEFNNRQRERSELERSLIEIQSSLAKARNNLASARQATNTHSLFASVRHLLTRCQEIIKRWQSGTTPSPHVLTEISENIATTLNQLSQETSTIAAAQQVVEQLEGPLQTVARLEAIEQERKRQLASLPPLAIPSETALIKLREAIASQQTSSLNARKPLEEALGAARNEEIAAEREGSAANAALGQAQAELAELEQEISREKGTAFLHDVRVSSPTRSEEATTHSDVERLQAKLAALGEIDELVLKEYQEVAERYEYLQKELTDTTNAYDHTDQLIRSLHKDIESQFRTQFQAIQKAFSENFSRLFEGGSACLEIIETIPEATESITAETTATIGGIEISAHPPGKKPQHITLLSGGEKALTSLALLLAIIQIQEPPFVVLDEVDAALDEANSYRFSQMLHAFGAKTQCLVITHNRETMAQANVLYGITIGADGVSRSYSVKLSDIEETESGEEITV